MQETMFGNGMWPFGPLMMFVMVVVVILPFWFIFSNWLLEMVKSAHGGATRKCAPAVFPCLLSVAEPRKYEQIEENPAQSGMLITPSPPNNSFKSKARLVSA